ncbi:MAG: hypothetical protein H0T42_20625 [Deltaproteobacteria bacterium]|nr:hypothetical protein [Deltaproteobacteria bacterium]
MRAALAVAIAASWFGACGRSEPQASRERAPLSPTLGDAARAATPSPLPPGTRQLITVIVPTWDATTAELRLWTRAGTAWKPTRPAWQGVIGKTGAAWGVGLHGRGAPTGRTGPLKREGDGASPAGVFALAGTYGYAAKPPAGAGLPYTQVDASWKCVDDSRSRHYNQILDQRTTRPEWTSAEDMRRSDELYTWVVDVAHNAARGPGDGSCIFLHVWGGPDSPTVGCTAMAEATLAELLARLSPGDLPALVLLPRAEYDALAAVWDLPR